jgi:hypothetical protein
VEAAMSEANLWHMPIKSRSVEMYFASVMLIIGLFLVAPGDTLQLGGYEFIRGYVYIFPGSEFGFGALIALTGALRWAALLINGWWYKTPAIRIFGCIVGSLLWTTMSISVLSSANLPGFPLIGSFTLTAIVFETFSAIRCAKDAHEQDSFGLRGKRRVRFDSGYR